MKHRLEVITESIIKGGSVEEKQAAWQYLRSESARAEASMVTVSHQAQQDVIGVLGAINPRDLAEYKTEKTIKKIQGILETMLGDSEALATTMVTANVIAGKIKSLPAMIKGYPLLKAIRLTDLDREHIQRMVNQIMGRLRTGASLTMASVKNTIQVTAVRANQNPNIKIQAGEKEADKKDSDSVKQEAVSNVFTPEEIGQKRARVQYSPKAPDDKELELIKKDPVKYANRASKQNVSFVTKLRNAYYQFKKNPLNSNQNREKALKEIEGDPAAKAVFDMNEVIRRQGLAAFIDKGGKRWSLENYCAMTTRTIGQQSTNLGEVFAREEHDLYYIVPHTGACPLCQKYEGRVYSRSGKDPNYPPLSSAFHKIDPNGSDDLDNTYWTIHPNCRHRIIRYIPKAHTEAKQEEIKRESNKPFELTEKQKEEARYYKERERVFNERTAALSEFKQYLQVMQPKDLCGNFIKFYEHKKANDDKYKQIKAKYQEIVSGKTPKEGWSGPKEPANKKASKPKTKAPLHYKAKIDKPEKTKSDKTEFKEIKSDKK